MGKKLKVAADYEVIQQQMGVDCNPDDTIVIDDFRGVLYWMYAQKTVEIQPYGAKLIPMTADFGGTPLIMTLRCDVWPKALTLPIHPKQSIRLDDCIGHKVTLEYAPLDHVAVTFIHAENSNVFVNAQ